MDDAGDCLTAAADDLRALRPELLGREPWPLSDTYAHVPEADWGPREVLSHLAEMLDYWTVELRRVAAGDGRNPVSFGRVATDADRLERIDTGRRKSTGELLDDVIRAIGDARSFSTGLSAAERNRVGTHPTRGELTVAASLDRFLCSHLGEHLSQLREILARPRSD
jgi:DinB superfamily